MIVISLGEGVDIEIKIEGCKEENKPKLKEAILEQDDTSVALNLSKLPYGVLRIRKPSPETVKSESDLIPCDTDEDTDDEEDLLDAVEEAKEGEIFQDLYDTSEVLGEGSFSTVFLTTHKTSGATFATKIYDRAKMRGSNDTHTIEIDNLKLCRDCSEVSRIQDTFADERWIQIVMETLLGGELFHCIVEKGASFSEGEARDASTSILRGLEYIHSKRIVHRSIKPENLLLKDKTKFKSVKLSDFGLSKQLAKKNECRTLCGTPGYMAPEILEQWPAYDVECDMFSFGVILFLLLGNYPPFDPMGNNDVNEIFEATREGDFKFYPTRWKALSPSAKNLVAYCLKLNPVNRMTAKNALNHAWMKEDSNTILDTSAGLKSAAVPHKKTAQEVKDDFTSFMNDKQRNSTSTTKASKRVSSGISGTFKEEGSSGRPVDAIYDKKECLGKGSFAVVHQHVHKATGKAYAIKEIDLTGFNKTKLRLLEGEIIAMKYVRGGPSIIRFFDVFRQPGKIYLVLEEMKGGDLTKRILEQNVYTEAEVRDICIHFFEAVRYCHRKRIAHRDIKLENLILAEKGDMNTVKLADFGFAKKCGKKTAGLKTICGTMAYMAPEVLKLPKDGMYDVKCDMWSVGVTVYALLVGYLPFQGKDMKKIKQRVLKAKYKFHKDYWGEISSSAKDMVSGMLELNPKKRLSANKALQSEWMGLDAEHLASRDLSGAQKQMKNMKLKAAVKEVMQLNQITKYFKPNLGGGLEMKITPEAKIDPIRETEEEEEGGEEEEEEEKFEKLYDLLEQIGKKGDMFSCHYNAINRRTNTEVVVKKISRNLLVDADAVALDNEIAVMRKLTGSKQIVDLREVFEDVDYAHIVMERVYGVSLDEQLIKIKRYSEFDAKEVAKNLLLGVHHCHKHRIAIRNLNPEILLLPDDAPLKVKLCDFECAKFVTFTNSLRTLCGVEEFAAPEMLLSHPAYDVSCDMWTVGVIVYIILSGTYPFRSKKKSDILKKIRYGEFKFPSKSWGDISDDAKQMLIWMLKVNPEERLTAADALASPWIHSRENIISK